MTPQNRRIVRCVSRHVAQSTSCRPALQPVEHPQTVKSFPPELLQAFGLRRHTVLAVGSIVRFTTMKPAGLECRRGIDTMT